MAHLVDKVATKASSRSSSGSRGSINLFPKKACPPLNSVISHTTARRRNTKKLSWLCCPGDARASLFDFSFTSCSVGQFSCFLFISVLLPSSCYLLTISKRSAADARVSLLSLHIIVLLRRRKPPHEVIRDKKVHSYHQQS